jgi:hypothetical protein
MPAAAMTGLQVWRSWLAAAHREKPPGSCSAKTNTQPAPAGGPAATAEPSADTGPASFTRMMASPPVLPSISAQIAFCNAWPSGDAAPQPAESGTSNEMIPVRAYQLKFLRTPTPPGTGS